MDVGSPQRRKIKLEHDIKLAIATSGIAYVASSLSRRLMRGYDEHSSLGDDSNTLQNTLNAEMR